MSKGLGNRFPYTIYWNNIGIIVLSSSKYLKEVSKCIILQT